MLGYSAPTHSSSDTEGCLSRSRSTDLLLGPHNLPLPGAMEIPVVEKKKKKKTLGGVWSEDFNLVQKVFCSLLLAPGR